MATIKYKQCYCQEVNGPWETITLIETKDIKETIILTQYKVTRLFKIKIVYPQIIKTNIINKNKGSQSTTKEGE
jgi:hypothetical protein